MALHRLQQRRLRRNKRIPTTNAERRTLARAKLDPAKKGDPASPN